ncbi:MAG: SAM-dependent methyltransferase [Anaerolineae bacterium]|nr:SAM-dependent methyltransferase [Anaerolineae bacterium]
MTITYDSVKPWGRLFAEYVGMFALTESELRGKRILGCGDGPASFNVEATAQGYRITSVDPIYALTVAQIEQRIAETWQQIHAQMIRNLDMFVWTAFNNPDEVKEARLGAMRQFLADLDQGRDEGRYLDASLPDLPFEDASFDLALCSNFLFLYSENLSTDFHIAATVEMCRVAREVRIFPLMGLANQESEHVVPVIEALTARGWIVERVPVAYEFLRGANQMLRLRR